MPASVNPALWARARTNCCESPGWAGEDSDGAGFFIMELAGAIYAYPFLTGDRGNWAAYNDGTKPPPRPPIWRTYMTVSPFLNLASASTSLAAVIDVNCELVRSA